MGKKTSEEQIEMNETIEDLELKQLEQFTGTERYHKGFMGVLLTDGVAYIMQAGYGWFVTDFSVVAKSVPALKAEPFLCVKLCLNTGEKKVKARMIVTDGNDKVLYTQPYEYTDAKRELKMFYTDNVLMLDNEY